MAAAELVQMHRQYEQTVAEGGRGFDEAARTLGWQPGIRVARACAELVDLQALHTEINNSEEERQLVIEIRAEIDESMHKLREALVAASDNGESAGVRSYDGDAVGAKECAAVLTFSNGSPTWAAVLHDLASAVVTADPAPKCRHQWKTLSGGGREGGTARVHNRADGAGKYVVYKCAVCSKVQRRYSDSRSS